MKQYWFVSAAALALISAVSANAADLETAPPAVAYNWSGFYAGVQGGGSWANLDQRIPAYGPVPDGDINGWLLGGYTGYNWQLNHLVFGLELGANWRNVSGSNDDTGAPEQLETRQNWDASLVGKVGVPFERTLVYGLAGVAVSGVESRYTHPVLGNSPWANDTVWGWTVGAGAEMAITQHVHARIEYRFADYEEADVACPACGPTFVTPRTHTATAGLSYNW
jgi:outer membrane immunogenic protein